MRSRPSLMAHLTAGGFLCLLASASASAQPASPAPEEPECLKCHSAIQATLQKKFRHAAVEMGCLTCHVNHREGSTTEERSGHYLSARQPDLCLTCHDPKDQKTIASHGGQPYQKAVCTGCHDPHSSEVPKLMPAQQHGPYGTRQCGACHALPAAGNIRLVAAVGSGLCLGCHEDLRQRLGVAKFKHSLLSSGGKSCVDCHDPHASNIQHFLKKPLPGLCNDCHASITSGKKFTHEPVRVSCTLCHDAHASDTTKNLHAAVNTLCLECHGSNAVKIIHSQDPVALFNGKVELRPKVFEELRWLQVSPNGKGGHPFPNHPVLSAPSQGKPEINCITCHRPHAGDGGRRRFVTEKANESLLCVRCH